MRQITLAEVSLARYPYEQYSMGFEKFEHTGLPLLNKSAGHN